MNGKTLGLTLAALAVAFASDAADWTADGEVKWKAAASGDFNTAANWEGDVMPGPKTNAVITRTGADYTVALDESPERMATNVIVIGNSGSYTTTVEVAGAGKHVTLDETFFKINANGVLRIADGATLEVNALTADATSTPYRYLFNGDSGKTAGRVLIDNATVDIDYKGAYWLGKNASGGSFTLTNGATVTLHDRNASAAQRHLTGLSGNTFILTDTSKIVVDNPWATSAYSPRSGGQFALGNLLLTGDAAIVASNKCFHLAGNGRAVVRDNAHLDARLSNADIVQSFYVYSGKSSTSTPQSYVFDFLSSWRGAKYGIVAAGLMVYGFYIGNGGDSVTVNMDGGSSILNLGNGFYIGNPAASQTTRGTLNVRKGLVYNGSTSLYNEALTAFAVGSSEQRAKDSNAFSYGTLNLYDGGAITNNSSWGSVTAANKGCYFDVGAGHADGTVNQYGGTLAHRHLMQATVGARGGTGRYNMSGGRAYFRGEVYVGGIPYERLQTVIAGFNHSGNSTFRAKYDYLNKGATGTVYVTGGKFETISNLCVSAYGKGTVRMGGDTSGLLVAQDIFLESTANGGETYTSDVVFDVGKGGTSLLKAKRKLAIGAGAELTVNVTETPDRGWTKLIEYGEVEGEFAKITVNGPGEVSRQTRKGVTAYWLKAPHGCAVIVR